LAERGGVRPGFDDVAARNVMSPFKGSSELMFIKSLSIERRVQDLAQGFVATKVASPRGLRLLSIPSEFLSSLRMMTAPECAVSLVKAGDVLYTFEGSPRRPGRPLSYLMA
jgi:hypothetical protein